MNRLLAGVLACASLVSAQHPGQRVDPYAQHQTSQYRDLMFSSMRNPRHAAAQQVPFLQYGKADLNGDGEKDIIMYRLQPQGKVSAKDLKKDPGRLPHDLEVVIQDGATKQESMFLVPGVSEVNILVLPKTNLEVNRPLMRSYPEIVLLINEKSRIETIGYNGERYEHDEVMYQVKR